MDDKYIVDYFYGPTCLKGKLLKRISNDILEYLNDRFSDSESIKETLFRMKHGLEVRPTCPICGSTLKFNEKGYFSEHCSKKCTKLARTSNIKKTKLERHGSENYNNRESAKQTCLKNYGVENVAQSDASKEKSKRTCLEKYGVEYASKSDSVKEKVKQTCLERYGYEYVLQSDEFKEQSRKTCLERYGVEYHVQSNEFKEQSKQTCLKKYGVEYSGQADFVKEKIKQTCLEKYDSESPLKSKEVLEKIKQTLIERYGVETAAKSQKYKDTLFRNYGVKFPLHSKKILNNVLETKRKNNSFNKSALEDRIFLFLKEKYNDVVRQYSSEEYPFNCDFYLPKHNIYIEVQGSWTHGGHPYIGTDDDIKQVNKWKNKGTEYYNNAVVTWTVRDVHKRETARQNKLKYIELFSENYIELEEKLNDLVE